MIISTAAQNQFRQLLPSSNRLVDLVRPKKRSQQTQIEATPTKRHGRKPREGNPRNPRNPARNAVNWWPRTAGAATSNHAWRRGAMTDIWWTRTPAFPTAQSTAPRGGCAILRVALSTSSPAEVLVPYQMTVVPSIIPESHDLQAGSDSDGPTRHRDDKTERCRENPARFNKSTWPLHYCGC